MNRYLCLLFCYFACQPAQTTPRATAPGLIQSAPAATKPTSMSASAPTSLRAAPEKYWVYVGTYTDDIYRFSFERKTGTLTYQGVTSGLKNPSFVAIHPSQKYLYAVNEVVAFRKFQSGAVSAFSIDAATGALTLLNHQPSGGLGPTHLSIDQTGKFLLVANYNSGSTEVLPINEDGSLGAPSSFIQHKGKSTNPKRQSGPHAHYVQTDPSNQFVFVPDLGLDKILLYKFDDAKGVITPNTPNAVSIKAGSGPRHLAMHPNGLFAYLLNELRSNIIVYSYDKTKGSLSEVQSISTLPSQHGGNSTAEILVHPSGKFLYSSNRGHNSIAMFSIDEATGKLTSLGYEPSRGKTPRNFNIDPAGEFLIVANQSSSSLFVFSIEQNTGLLTFTGESEKVPVAACVQFVPAP